MALGVNEDILGLDISMADALSMDIGNGSKQLVGVDLDQQVWDHLLHLQVLFHDTVCGIWDVVHHHIKVNFLWLVSVGVKRLTHFDAVRVVKHLENLQLSVLVALVLEHLLDGHGLACLRNCCLEDDSERTVSDDLLRVVREALLTIQIRKLILPIHRAQCNFGR